MNDINFNISPIFNSTWQHGVTMSRYLVFLLLMKMKNLNKLIIQDINKLSMLYFIINKIANKCKAINKY